MVSPRSAAIEASANPHNDLAIVFGGRPEVRMNRRMIGNFIGVVTGPFQVSVHGRADGFCFWTLAESFEGFDLGRPRRSGYRPSSERENGRESAGANNRWSMNSHGGMFPIRSFSVFGVK